MIPNWEVMYLGSYIVAMKTQPQPQAQASAASMATVPTAAERRKMKKVSTSSTSSTPYSVHHLRSRRRRRSTDSQRNSVSSLTETTATVITATNFENLDEVVEDCCSAGGEDVVTSGAVSGGFTVTASCCSSNYASSSSEDDEGVRKCTSTSEIVADPEVESDETLSRLSKCCEAYRESEGRKKFPTTKKSTVGIKMPSESEIEDFFAAAEKDLQKRFSDKYNFDVVNDLPLEGRYEWVQIKP